MLQGADVNGVNHDELKTEENEAVGLQEQIHMATQGVADLRFEEEDEEDTYYTKDLPVHACGWEKDAQTIIKVS